MKLSVRDAATMLSVPENDLYRSIKDGSLRAYKMNHQYFLNRAELLEWATTHDVTVPSEVLEEGGSELLAPSVADAIERGGIQLAVPGKTPAAVLRAIANELPLEDESDKDLILSMLVARQAQTTTAVGHGIAFPHVRSPIVLDIEEPIVVIAYLAEPVDFAAPDKQPVTVLFTFVTPTIRTHHRILSRLAHLVRDPRFAEALKARAGADVLVPLARTIEAALDRGKKSGASAA